MRGRLAGGFAGRVPSGIGFTHDDGFAGDLSGRIAASLRHAVHAGWK